MGKLYSTVLAELRFPTVDKPVIPNMNIMKATRCVKLYNVMWDTHYNLAGNVFPLYFGGSLK